MANKSNRTSVNQLIQAGREEAKNVQEIKSVATSQIEEKVSEAKATNENSTLAVEEPVIQKESGTVEPESSRTSTKKGLAMLLSKER
ncbi:hypothetical protein ACIXMQ_22285 [Bacteroides fragilis]